VSLNRKENEVGGV